MIQLKAMTTSISLEGIAKIYRNDIWKLHGVPTKILSDQGPQFASKFMGELINVVATTRRNGTHSLLTSAKLLVGYPVMVITRELNKEPLLHCSSIYINYMWSMLQQY